MPAKKFNYKNAMDEIEEIVQKIENEEIEVDELSQLVKKAAMLLKQCKSKLRTTSEELDGILDDIES